MTHLENTNGLWEVASFASSCTWKSTPSSVVITGNISDFPTKRTNLKRLKIHSDSIPQLNWPLF
jgi:hypothetical protein